MKATINTLQNALTFQLQGLFYAEKKVSKEFNSFSYPITSGVLKIEIQNYIESGASKLLKLERIFNYLMQEQMIRKNEIINTLIEETHRMLSFISTSHLKDLLIVSCIQNINAYKISSYRTAYLFAAELELDTASDLLQQILEWELASSRGLGIMAIKEFNTMQKAVN